MFSTKYINMIEPTQPICIHRYLTECASNPQPPGMADFIRGTIATYLYLRNLS